MNEGALARGASNEALVDAADLPAGDAKARAALDRYALFEVATRGHAFDEAYRLLDAEFGPRGELERREVVARWLDERADAAQGPGPLSRRYHLIVARDRDGRIAGMRDCHVVVDPTRAVAVVYLAHALVLDEHRRTGLATLLRTAPVTLGRRALAALAASTGAAAAGARAELLLAAEMEPIVAGDPASIVRLVAYGRAGFRAVAPRCLPYCQPDFRDLDARAPNERDVPRPLPLVAVVRWIGHEDATALPARLADAFVRHLYAVFATHCRDVDLAGPRERALEALRAAGDPVPLLALPAGTGDTAAITPLTRDEVLRWHAEPLHGSTRDDPKARGDVAP